MSTNPSHLVERVAERLRGVGGLAAVDPVPERDIRDVARREAERRPAPRRVVAPTAPDFAQGATEGESHADSPREDISGDVATEGPDGDRLSTAMTVAAALGDKGGRGGPSRAMVDPQQTPSAVTDPMSALSMAGAGGSSQLDMAALERAGLVVGHKVRTRISEEFRITVGHILRTMHSNYSPGRGAPNVLMVTSARPGEGKSFSSLNLAGSIAQHTQREVLLVDVDAKQRSLSAELGLADRPGLLDLSSNTSLRIEDVIIRTAIPHLSVITIGSGHTIGSEISPSRPVSTLVERIARRFPNAVVLLDAPPCLSTSDPSTLAPFVGQIVLVVEAERTQRNEVVASLDLIKACPSITLMLNKIRLTTSYTFGAYHYFGTYS